VAEKRELLERLAARLAHEIRNPLSSLDIHVQLLEEDLGTLTPSLRDQLNPRLEIIHGELHRLESIVEHFLRLAGPSALDLEPSDVRRLVSHVSELLRPEAAAREIQIVTEFQGALPTVMADPVRLTQALVNLVINAMQAVQRSGRIAVSAGKDGEHLALTVHDSGPGIAEEVLASIFDPYFTTKTEGNGLGLWIAQQIVTAHGGTLKAHNAQGGGAIFTVRLPINA
jgi:signal transduction histidine kinase